MIRRTCSTCFHNGCCTYPCGGPRWSAAYIECARCGEVVPVEETVEVKGADYCGGCAAEVDDGEEATA